MLKKVFFISLLFMFFSCEKQITLQPENSEEKIVVSAIFSNLAPITTLSITKSKGIYEDILNHPKITDADVKIIDLNTNDITTFTSNNDGTYSTIGTGIVGHRYRLEIDAEGKHITGEQTMLSNVSLNQVRSFPIETGSNEYYLQMKFDDDANTTDYYAFICYPLTNPNDDIRVIVKSDLEYDRNILGFDVKDELFNENENWLVVLFHIDRKNYEYLSIMNRAKNSLVNGAHPFYGISLGNPKNTVEGDNVMGYFIASPVGVSPVNIGH